MSNKTNVSTPAKHGAPATTYNPITPPASPSTASPVQGAASASGAKGAAVKPWQERMTEAGHDSEPDPFNKLCWELEAKDAEIADWRALAERAQAAQPSGAVAEYRSGSWFKARTLDEMQEFYLSRLPAIREAAKEHGYAIGAHGSQRRDFDLMAMQWRDNASDKDTLAHAIAVAACGVTHDGAHQWTKKPSGRFAVSLPICWTDHGNPDFKKPSMGHIDLSVIDLATPAPEQEAAQVVSTSQVHPDMALPSRQVKPKECDHGRNRTAHYDYIQCDECGAINTDKGWGVASNMWFKSTDEAKFYQQHGRLPEGIKS